MLTFDTDRQQIKGILDGKELFVFDMDGTIYLGKIPFVYAVEYITELRKHGKKVLFFTNNASHSPDFYMEKLMSLGFAPSREELCTSGDVTCAFLRRFREGKTVYLLGTPELYDHFRSYEIDMVNDRSGHPDGRVPDIVITSFDTTLNYEKLKNACEYIRGGAEYLCTHPDFNCPTETGFIPDSGAIAAAVTASTGVSPLFFGKPSRETAEMICEISGTEKENIAVFGDRMYTDIALGRRNGIESVLVLSGETTETDVEVAEEKDRPDILLRSLEDALKIQFSV